MSKEILELELELTRVKTSHGIHFFFSFITGGLWTLLWIIAGYMSIRKRQSLREKIALLKIEQMEE